MRAIGLLALSALGRGRLLRSQGGRLDAHRQRSSGTLSTWDYYVQQLTTELAGVTRQEIKCGKPVTNNMPNDRTPEKLKLLCNNNKSGVQVWQRGNHTRIMTLGGEDRVEAESKVDCQETCDSCYDQATEVAECEACPCTPIRPLESAYGYLLVPLNEIRKHCADRPVSVVFVGLGAGTQVSLLKSICPTGLLRAVELRGEVIDVAARFFGLRGRRVTPETASAAAEMEVVHASAEEGARALAQKLPGQFDYALVDCMALRDIPLGCRSEKLYSSLKELLKPGGKIKQWTWKSNMVGPFLTLTKFGNVTKDRGWLSLTKG